MTDWLGHILASVPWWLVLPLTIIIGIVATLFYWGPELLTWLFPNRKTEWQKSWYKKKENKHGKN